MSSIAWQTVSLILAGLLAGEELIVRWGVQPALRTLDDAAHIQARVALVRSLRVVVPILMIPTVLTAVAALIATGASGGTPAGTGLFGASTGTGFRWAGIAALTAFLLFSFLGTVPINMRVITWQSSDPPPDWHATVTRWERIDVFRSASAIIAFACFAVAMTTQITR
jgi:hypothetical protein